MAASEPVVKLEDYPARRLEASGGYSSLIEAFTIAMIEGGIMEVGTP
jgi:hypothetical protein